MASFKSASAPSDEPPGLTSDEDTASSKKAPDSWRPTRKQVGQPTPECVKRIMTDIKELMRHPLPGIYVRIDEEAVQTVHALITGPFDTPYEGGFFYFLLEMPNLYPMESPKVQLMTTGQNSVRFGPNLYRNGKVCLSILGTWAGPSWSPAMGIGSLLISIQSLMCERPFHLEPGFERASNMKDVTDYTEAIRHDTLRVAVVEMATEGSAQHRILPEAFKETVKELFPTFVECIYEVACTTNMHKDGQQVRDPFGENRGKFQYGTILRKIRALSASFEDQKAVEEARQNAEAMAIMGR